MIINFNKTLYLNPIDHHNLYKKVKSLIISQPIKNIRIIYNIRKKEILVAKMEQQKTISLIMNFLIIQKLN